MSLCLQHHLQSLTAVAWLYIVVVHQGMAQTHEDVLAIFDDKFANYNTEVRPLKDQSKVLYVGFSFELVSIMEVNDVTQNFICNGFFAFTWRDEIIQWDREKYGGQRVIFPKAKDIWRPRIVLVNTLNERDLFADDYAPTYITYDGEAGWFPGSLVPTSCKLDMDNYPFDEQICRIHMISMRHYTDELQYRAIDDAAQQNMFTPNGEWKLVSSNITVFNSSDYVDLSNIMISFTIKRNPSFVLMNIILPVVFLSALNLLVFFIPAESGEKIGYGITVLLALAVYLSVVSGMLPRNAESVPKVTIYLFMLLIISLLTVLDSIVIVYLHHLEEREGKHLRVKEKFQSAVSKVAILKYAGKSTDGQATGPNIADNPWSKSARKVIDNSDANPTKCDENKPKRNRYKLIGQYIDIVSFVVFMLIWLCITIGFLTDIA